MTNSQMLTAEPLGDPVDTAGMAEKLVALLKLRTLPIGMKLFEDADEMDKIPGIRRPTDGVPFTTCQMVTQARLGGMTLGIRHDNVMQYSNCGGVVGLNVPADEVLSGERMDGVWFGNREASKAHQDQMPRVPAGRYTGLAVSPLRTGRLTPPDICLFYGTPAQMILFFNGLQRNDYKRYQFSITGESACADSWGTALKTREVSLSIPCFAERRYGGVADDEMLLACAPHDLAKAIRGLEELDKVGLRYPIMPYSAQNNPAPGLSRSYPKPAAS